LREIISKVEDFKTKTGIFIKKNACNIVAEKVFKELEAEYTLRKDNKNSKRYILSQSSNKK
jgi:hypothetical protein